MHETAIAQAILEQVLRIAAENGLARISEVRLRVGELRLIVPEALDLAWQAVSRGTAVDGSALQICEVQALVRCRQCDKQYRPTWPVFACPQCGRADVEILAGNELVLWQISGEPAEGGRECSS